MHLQYGKPISEELSKVLSSSIAIDQRRSLAHQFEVSPGTVWNLIKRNTVLNSRNKDLLHELIREALLSNEEKLREVSDFIKVLNRYQR